MKIVAAIACRNNSTRLYGKPLQILKTTTILDYIINNLKECQEINSIVLAISEIKGNEPFIEYAEKNSIKYVIGDDSDVLGRIISACDLVKGEIVFRITSESPFFYKEGINNAIKSHIKSNADYTAHAKLPDGCMFELININALKISHLKGSKKHKSELVSLYINENSKSFRLNIIEVDKSLQRPNYRLTIDYPEDLILAREIFNYFESDKEHVPIRKIIKLLDKRPKLRSLVDNLVESNYVKPYH